jgi:hypothetical protein
VQVILMIGVVVWGEQLAKESQRAQSTSESIQDRRAFRAAIGQPSLEVFLDRA